MKNMMFGLLGSFGVLALAGCSGSAATEPPTPATGSPAPDGGGPARSAPAQGGASGTVDSVSAPSFTMTTAAGQKVTVNETSSTTYQNATGATSASAITTGENVLVLGIVDSTTITATQVIVQPDDGGGSAASAAAGVIPFQQGAPSQAKQVGQIPADYTEGAGTIISGTEADQVTEPALAGYPGVLVDRVAQLGSGAYNVHCIGVNWPHHIFVDQGFKVVGAN
jgi:membrane-bound inhibitor of C-type lysozyme